MPFLLEAYRLTLGVDIRRLSDKIEKGAISHAKVKRCSKERDRLAEEFLLVGLYANIKKSWKEFAI